MWFVFAVVVVAVVIFVSTVTIIMVMIIIIIIIPGAGFQLCRRDIPDQIGPGKVCGISFGIMIQKAA